MATARADATATLLADGRVLIAGGYDTRTRQVFASAELYDPETGTFTAAGSMASKRFFQGAVALQDGRVLVVGGYSAPYSSGCASCTGILASVELFGPTTGTFSPAGSTADGRYGAAAAQLQDGRVLVVEGFSQGSNLTTTGELYDPKTGAYSTTRSMADGQNGHIATLLQGGLVLITGGHDASGDSTASAEVFVPAPWRPPAAATP
jgi:hypothetical protein